MKRKHTNHHAKTLHALALSMALLSPLGYATAANAAIIADSSVNNTSVVLPSDISDKTVNIKGIVAPSHVDVNGDWTFKGISSGATISGVNAGSSFIKAYDGVTFVDVSFTGRKNQETVLSNNMIDLSASDTLKLTAESGKFLAANGITLKAPEISFTDAYLGSYGTIELEASKSIVLKGLGNAGAIEASQIVITTPILTLKNVTGGASNAQSGVTATTTVNASKSVTVTDSSGLLIGGYVDIKTPVFNLTDNNYNRYFTVNCVVFSADATTVNVTNNVTKLSSDGRAVDITGAELDRKSVV